jgi:hypothetical protein
MSAGAHCLGPGIGLLATGLVSVSLGVTVQVYGWPDSTRLVSALATLSLVSGPVILCGAFSLFRCEFLWLVRVSSWLALLPSGFGWIVGLPAGFWTLATLARPEVQAAFHYRKAEYDAEQDQILDEADADLRDS